MEIGPEYATLYDPYDSSVLVQRLYWSVQVMSSPQSPSPVNGTQLPSPPSWAAMHWTTLPTVQELQLGGYHRVIVGGILDNRLAVAIFFDGKSTSSPAAGPKISVVLQSTAGRGLFRAEWRFEGVSVSAFNLENRTGSNRQLIYGPRGPNLYGNHLPTGENSLVALASDGSTILWGANWQDAFQYYRGTSVSATAAGASVSMQFGLFPLRTGQAVIIDPIIEGGGGDTTPTVGISTPSISESSTTTTLTWYDSPSTACDTFQWGTSTSYGNTVNTCSHSVTLSYLQTGVLYYYQITACASGYYCGTYRSSFYAARQLLDNTWFGTTYLNPNGINYPWQGNQVFPWEGHVFEIGGSWNCNEYSIDLTSACFPNDYIINPVVNYPDGSYSYSYQVKGNLDNSYQDPGHLGVSTASMGCDFPSGTVNPNGWSVYSWNNVYRPIGSSTPRSCINSVPSWSSPHSQRLLDPNQYFATTVSRTAPVSRTQTIAAWWIGWAIANLAVDFYVKLDNEVSFKAPDACGNVAVRQTNLLEFEPYVYMQSMASNQPRWGAFPVKNPPVVVALSNGVTANILGCSTSGPYWMYVRTHPFQVDACYPNWCQTLTYPMHDDIVSAETSAQMTALEYPWTLNGDMMNFQIGIETANYAMLYWITDTEWWGSG